MRKQVRRGVSSDASGPRCQAAAAPHARWARESQEHVATPGGAGHACPVHERHTPAKHMSAGRPQQPGHQAAAPGAAWRAELRASRYEDDEVKQQPKDPRIPSAGNPHLPHKAYQPRKASVWDGNYYFHPQSRGQAAATRAAGCVNPRARRPQLLRPGLHTLVPSV